jgi:hypothetical protein
MNAFPKKGKGDNIEIPYSLLVLTRLPALLAIIIFFSSRSRHCSAVIIGIFSRLVISSTS